MSRETKTRAWSAPSTPQARVISLYERSFMACAPLTGHMGQGMELDDRGRQG
jgi:hypothetical protein